jgi:hypothetical protein
MNSEGSVHVCLAPCTGQNIMEAGVCGGGSSPHGGQDAEGGEVDRKGPGTRLPQGPTPSYLLSPVRNHLVKFLPPP